MWVEGRVEDLYSRSETEDVVQRTSFRYALIIGDLNYRPFYLLRGVPEELAAHAGKKVAVEGVERPDYGLDEYAVLKCEVIEVLE